MVDKALHRRIVRTVRRLQKAAGYKDTTVGEVAKALGLSCEATVAAIRENCYWIGVDEAKAQPIATWHVFEDGE